MSPCVTFCLHALAKAWFLFAGARQRYSACAAHCSSRRWVARDLLPGWKALMWKISNNLIWCVTILDLTCSLPDSGAIDRHWRRVTFKESFSYTIWSRIRIIQFEFFFALDVVTAFFLQSSFEKMQLLYLSSLFLHKVSWVMIANLHEVSSLQSCCARGHILVCMIRRRFNGNTNAFICWTC